VVKGCRSASADLSSMRTTTTGLEDCPIPSRVVAGRRRERATVAKTFVPDVDGSTQCQNEIRSRTDYGNGDEAGSPEVNVAFSGVWLGHVSMLVRKLNYGVLDSPIQNATFLSFGIGIGSTVRVPNSTVGTALHGCPVECKSLIVWQKGMPPSPPGILYLFFRLPIPMLADQIPKTANQPATY